MYMNAWLPSRTPAAVAIRGAGSALFAATLASLLGLDDLIGAGGLGWFPPVLAVGAVAGLIGVAGALTALAGTLAALALLVATVPSISRAADGYIRSDSVPGSVDAVLVLSASVSPDGRLGPAAVDRLLEGATLTKRGASRNLVVSRVWAGGEPWPVSSDRDQKELIAAIDPTATITILDSVGSTRLEAERLAAVAQRTGWRRVVVVTSPIHSSRACATVEKVGFEVFCHPSPDRTAAVRTQRRASDRFRVFGQGLYEWAGWRKYRWMGWL
ncbi:MAG: YdcF family protein [Gemmatimonadetes bacterium]|nr:YdcF family protein [Gemmatimonadota bacterium]